MAKKGKRYSSDDFIEESDRGLYRHFRNHQGPWFMKNVKSRRDLDKKDFSATQVVIYASYFAAKIMNRERRNANDSSLKRRR